MDSRMTSKPTNNMNRKMINGIEWRYSDSKTRIKSESIYYDLMIYALKICSRYSLIMPVKIHLKWIFLSKRVKHSNNSWRQNPFRIRVASNYMV